MSYEITDQEKYIAECVQIDEFAIREEYQRLPADYAYWNGQYAKAYRAWTGAKLATEQTHALLHAKLQSDLESYKISKDDKKQPRVTVGEIESAVLRDPRYAAARMAELDAEAEKIKLWGVMEALRAKREMLVSLGATMRQEAEHDPLIRHARAVEAEARRGGR
jgi:hypothetical protein